MGDIKAADIRQNSPQTVWIQTQVGKPGRPSLVKLLDATIKMFEEMKWDTKVLKEISAWVKKKGNPTIGRKIGSLSKEQQGMYLKVKDDIVAQKCNPHSNGKDKPLRPGVVELLNVAIKEFKQKKWDTRKLKWVRNWVINKGNPKIGKKIGSLSPQQREKYLKIKDKVVAESCGYKQYHLPSIEGVTILDAKTGNVIQDGRARPGQELKIVVTGSHLPVGSRFQFLIKAPENVGAGVATYTAGNSTYIEDKSTTPQEYSVEIDLNDAEDKLTFFGGITILNNAPIDDPRTEEIENVRAIRISSRFKSLKPLVDIREGVLIVVKAPAKADKPRTKDPCIKKEGLMRAGCCKLFEKKNPDKPLPPSCKEE